MYQRRKTPPPYRRKPTNSAASKNAGHAATNRANNNNSRPPSSASTTRSSTPGRPKVQIPKKLSEHTNQKDIILRCANRFAPYSLCVDTLLRSLRTIRSDPKNRKYHTIDTAGIAFRRSLSAPGVIDFMKAINFHYSPNKRKVLALSRFDPALFNFAISALERIQTKSSEYAKHKALRTFRKEIDSCLAGTNNSDNNDNTETLARERYLSKLPREPTKGGSPITVEFGLAVRNTANDGNDIDGTATNVVAASTTDSKEHTTTTVTKKITRGFDSDDTLGDVVNWLGGQASAIPNKLRTGEWCIIDRNRVGSEEDYNYHRLDVSELSDKTLHYIGCWPSGRIAIVPRLTTTTPVLAN